MGEYEEPLLLKSCREGLFGEIYDYPGGMIAQAGFIYLCGKSNVPLLQEHISGWKGRTFVCRSEEWKVALTGIFLGLKQYQRFMMYPLDKFILNEVQIPSEDYTLQLFGEKEFSAHPFGHGYNYKDFESFEREGVGAVVYYGDKIVASASSYLTLGNEIEVDVSTLSEHRRKGLARICAWAMLRECSKRGMIAHWDAQNTASLALAEKLGFKLDAIYTGYCFILPEEIG